MKQHINIFFSLSSKTIMLKCPNYQTAHNYET